jgi:hypothetical protein
MNSRQRSVSAQIGPAETGTRECLAQSPGSFFLTLSAVAAPVPVRPPTSPALQRFRFFFTRRREGDRECCWLHFGHFHSVDEAQKWLDVMRRIYPRAVMRQVQQAQETPHTHELAEPKSLSDTQVLALLEKNRVEDEHSGQQARRPAPEPRRGPTLEDTLNDLFNSASDTLEVDGDSLSSTGVRHLRVEVTRHPRAAASPRRKP